jgi:hypothetical protein
MVRFIRFLEDKRRAFMGRIAWINGLLVGAILMLSLATASGASADPRYTVMNAEGGIYWRSEPNWSAAEAVSGFGVYNGTTIEVHCYQSGSSVPGSADTIWEQATDVAGAGYGSGWLNEHFINDGQPIDQPSPGVPACGATPTPPPSPPRPAPAPGLATGEFTVLNAEGGIYWRSAPDWNTPEAITGNGFYPDTVVKVICYQSGTANVPGSTDSMWEQATDVGGSGSGSGWINEHFINDSQPLNEHSPGIPACSSATAPGPPGAASPVASTGQNLALDPYLWCAQQAEREYQTQIREADWIVVLHGYVGTPGVNNWRCRDLVAITVGGELSGGGDGDFHFPPVDKYAPIDFTAMCHEQFPGATLKYVAGPVMVAPWPWQCVGQPGKYYPPPRLGLASLVRDGGYVAQAVPASGPGTLTLALSTAPGGRVASVASRVLLASGSRVVDRSGSYAIKIRMTSQGRRVLRIARKLRIRFTLRFTPSGGQSVVESRVITVGRSATPPRRLTRRRRPNS